MKTNKEIIIEELYNMKVGSLSWCSIEKEIERVATNLLSKLQILDRDKVNKAIDNLIKDQAVTSDGDRVYLDNVEWYMFIQEICQLIPEEKRVVIRKGKIFVRPDTMGAYIYIGDNDDYAISGSIVRDLEKYIGKQVILKLEILELLDAKNK